MNKRRGPTGLVLLVVGVAGVVVALALPAAARA